MVLLHDRMLAPPFFVVARGGFCYTGTNIRTRNMQPRQLNDIDDDMVWAVLDGKEDVIAHLQQEREAVMKGLQRLDIL